jgi:hypothetical protein
VAEISRCWREFHPNGRKEFPDLAKLLTREFVALAASPKASLALMRPLFEELSETAAHAPALSAELVGGFNRAFRRTPSIAGVGAEVGGLVGIVGSPERARAWISRAETLLTAEIRTGVVGESAVEGAVSAILSAQEFAAVLERSSRVGRMAVPIASADIDPFATLAHSLNRSADPGMPQDIAAIISRWKAIRDSRGWARRATGCLGAIRCA